MNAAMTLPLGVPALPCRFAGCTFGQLGGRCVNGIANPVGECPDYDPTKPASDSTSEVSVEAPVGGNSWGRVVPLHRASALDERLAYEITRAARTKVVVVSGVANSGKTTLVTSIYERFNNGPIGKYRFGGSRTIHAFEEWCHDSRDASDRELPDTPHTPFTAPGEQRFLHLRVCRPDDEFSRDHARMQDLLITDLHGEKFERVRDDSAAAAGLGVLPRADHFAQLIDGAKLLNAGERHQTVADARRILQSCFDAGVISMRTIVHIVATKWDIVRASGEETAVRAFWDSRIESLAELSAGRVGAFAAHITAARAPLSAPEAEWGAAGLLTMWIEESRQGPEVLRDRSEMPPVRREFDRFGVRFE